MNMHFLSEGTQIEKKKKKSSNLIGMHCGLVCWMSAELKTGS